MEDLEQVEFCEASVFDKPVSQLSYGDFEKFDALLRLTKGRFLTLVLNDGCVSFVTAGLPVQVLRGEKK